MSDAYEVGTRSRANTALSVAPDQGRPNGKLTRDAGLSKLATGALVFANSGASVTLAGALGAFMLDDVVEVTGTALNNGFYTVLGTGANALVLHPAPQNENAPATATVRTP